VGTAVIKPLYIGNIRSNPLTFPMVGAVGFLDTEVAEIYDIDIKKTMSCLSQRRGQLEFKMAFSFRDR
jgi:hypothetical protein